MNSDLKIEILCYGVKCSPNILEKINKLNPYAWKAKSVHWTSFALNGVSINVPIAEKYTNNSPFSLKEIDNCFFLYKENKLINQISIAPVPIWYEKSTSNGTKMASVLNVHCKNVLALSEYTGCYYAAIGKKCLFCSVTPSKIDQVLNNVLRKKDIIETLIYALQENENYSLSLSEGSRFGEDRGALYFCDILQEIKNNNIRINTSVELVPPKDNHYLEMLKQSGATSIIMNIEFYDEYYRKKYCPGKSEVSIEQYFSALSYAVKLYGEGNVSSVLIVGIEPSESTIKCAKKLIDIGVIPTLIPFKPYDNSALSEYPTTNPELVKKVEKEIRLYWSKKPFKRICSHSCISCNACCANNYSGCTVFNNNSSGL